MNPEDLQYTKDHEWVRREGDTVRVGVTDYAQEALGKTAPHSVNGLLEVRMMGLCW